MEHGPESLSQVQNLISAAVLTNVIPIIRTFNASDTAIHQPLDLGALGSRYRRYLIVKQLEIVSDLHVLS